MPPEGSAQEQFGSGQIAPLAEPGFNGVAVAGAGAPPDEGQNDRIKQLYETHVEDTLRLLRGRRSVSTLVVDYSETLARPEHTARRIVRFLGARLDADRMAAAADPALHRNRSTAT